MATTYEAIATYEVGASGAANIEFTSIAADWTDVCILLSARSTRAATQDTATIQFNGNASNYSMRRLYADGSTAYSDNDTSLPTGHYSAANATANTFGNVIIYIPNYASSNYKSVSSEGVAETNGTTVFMSMVAGLWSNTSAITSIKLTPFSGSFVQYSTATLYGIKNS